jgi:predicted dehydrogenase
MGGAVDGNGDGEESADLRVGVVGMGIGHLHLLCWLGVRGASAVAVADTDDDRRNGAAMAWNLPAVATLDELLELGVDIVDLCTPPAGHEEQILRCLDAGVHVICEKPLVGSVAACDRLAAAVAEAEARTGARLMPIQQYRFGDGAARARALVEAGITGRLFTASASTWWRRDRDHYDESPWRGTWASALGGTVVNHAIHIHDLLTWIGGPLVELQAQMATRVNDTDTEDCAVAIGRTADGGLVTLNATTGARPPSRPAWCGTSSTSPSSRPPRPTTRPRARGASTSDPPTPSAGPPRSGTASHRCPTSTAASSRRSSTPCPTVRSPSPWPTPPPPWSW